MKDYQVLLSGILIALAIYLGLTHTEERKPNEFGDLPVRDSAHDTDFEVCMSVGLRFVDKEIFEKSLTYGQIFEICSQR
jgi:hypothetical protein